MEIIHQSEFETLANDISSIYNLLYDTPNYYSPLHVQISILLMDYNDGWGYRVISRASIKNPEEEFYDMVVDIQGQPMDALRKMYEDLTALLKEELPEEAKKQEYRYN